MKKEKDPLFTSNAGCAEGDYIRFASFVCVMMPMLGSESAARQPSNMGDFFPLRFGLKRTDDDESSWIDAIRNGLFPGFLNRIQIHHFCTA